MYCFYFLSALSFVPEAEKRDYARVFKVCQLDPPDLYLFFTFF
jgi:hypothetical protein